MRNNESIPIGMFYCKGCNKNRYIGVRIGKYGNKCSYCAPKGKLEPQSSKLNQLNEESKNG